VSAFRLDEVAFFAGCNPAFLDSLSVLLSEVSFSKDDVVFRQNEVADEMVIILTGSIERRIEVSCCRARRPLLLQGGFTCSSNAVSGLI
jgi:hypothetical protein